MTQKQNLGIYLIEYYKVIAKLSQAFRLNYFRG